MPVETICGQSPIIVVLPYAGVNVPQTVYGRLSAAGRSLSDTDRYLSRLVADLAAQPTIVRADFQRCVSDLEVNTADPLANHRRAHHIGVIPLSDREGRNIWISTPKASEASHWRAAYYAPFHAIVNAQLARLRARHQHAVIVTLHTLRNDDDLSDADIVVSADLTSSEAVTLSTQLTRLFDAETQYSCRLTGKASARWITRHHSKPDRGVHALQISIRPACYLSTTGETGLFDDAKAAPLKDLLNQAFQVMIDHTAR